MSRYDRCPSCGGQKQARSTRCGPCTSAPSAHPELCGADWSWIVGIVEGEGTFVVKHSGLAVVVEMTDFDIVSRLHRLLGVGNVCYPKTRAAHHKASAKWSVSKLADSAWLAGTLYPHLSPRRQTRIAELLSPVPPGATFTVDALAYAVGYLEGEGTFCASGHQQRVAQVSAHSVDQSPLVRLCDVFGGSIGGPYAPKNPKWSPTYHWYIHGAAALEVMERVAATGRPGERRAAAIARVQRAAASGQVFDARRHLRGGGKSASSGHVGVVAIRRHDPETPYAFTYVTDPTKRAAPTRDRDRYATALEAAIARERFLEGRADLEPINRRSEHWAVVRAIRTSENSVDDGASTDGLPLAA